MSGYSTRWLNHGVWTPNLACAVSLTLPALSLKKFWKESKFSVCVPVVYRVDTCCRDYQPISTVNQGLWAPNLACALSLTLAALSLKKFWKESKFCVCTVHRADNCFRDKKPISPVNHGLWGWKSFEKGRNSVPVQSIGPTPAFVTIKRFHNLTTASERETWCVYWV